MSDSSVRPIKAARPLVTWALVGINVGIFSAGMIASHGDSFSSRELYDWGAVTSNTLETGEYWRLLSHAFLHLNLAHIATNMLCLLFWGGPLEQRVGIARYLTIYLLSAIGGGLTSIIGHQVPFLTVGASGAISGILGALLSFTLLGRFALAASFFVVNIGLNVALSATVPNIDWTSHLGGFITGMAVAALIELAHRRSHAGSPPEQPGDAV